MKVYIGKKNEVVAFDRKKVVDIVRPLLDMNKFGEKELLRKYGRCYNKYKLVFNVNDSDFAILPFAWNYYRQNDKMKEVSDFISICRGAGKEIITVNLGDFGVKPGDNDVIIFRQSGYQSRRLKKQFAMSVFFSDPVKEYFKNKIIIREKIEKPLIGFCGQGKQKMYKYALVFASTVYGNLKYYLGIDHNEPQTLYPSTLRRNIVLNNLIKSDKVLTDFIIREKYRGGIKQGDDILKAKLEFYNNIRNTDYTLCIRGGGNFSVRIYETLANGRIPLFVNTDSILPLDNFIDWKKHVVWVEEKDIKYIDEKLSDFHNEIHPDDFKQMQINNRQLWENYLSLGGFYCHLDKVIEYVS